MKKHIPQKIADHLEAFETFGRFANLTEEGGKIIASLMREAYNQGKRDEEDSGRENRAYHILGTETYRSFDQWINKRFK